MSGYGSTDHSAVGIHVEKLEVAESMDIHVVVYNETEGNPTDTPEPPDVTVNPPDDPEIIEVPDETPPLAGLPHAGNNGIPFQVLLPFGLALVGVGLILRKTNTRGKYVK